MYNQISPELKALITPLKPGEKAEYRILKSPEKRLEVVGDHAELRTQKLEPETFFASAEVFDPFVNRKTALFVAGRKQSVNTIGGPQQVEMEASLTFTNGILLVPYGETDLYEFMELWPANKDNVNPHRVATTKFICERVQPAKTAKKAAELADMGVQAAYELRNYSYDQLQIVARRLRLDATQDRDSLYTQLVSLATADSEKVYYAIGERAVEVESLVANAVKEEVLAWVPEHQMFIIKESQQNFFPSVSGNPQENLIIELMEPRFQKQRAMLEKLVAAKLKAAVSKKK